MAIESSPATALPRQDAARTAGIEFEGVSVTYPDGTVAVRDLNLNIRKGELVVLVGPSGCGKSTALRALAGLQDISGGRVMIGTRDVTDLDPQDRDIAMVFQNYALYPHKTVYENLAYPLRVRNVGKAAMDDQVQRTANLLALTPLLHRKPRALSGGQRQRVAMGRALVRDPVAFLMDEPLSNLDAALRVEMRTEILALHHQLGVTTVYVTHDQVEAMTMGDRVAVIRAGMLQQFDSPQTLYERPRNVFVASFVGSPAINLVMARVMPDRGGFVAAGHEIRLPASRLGDLSQLAPGAEAIVGIRPEAFGHRQDPEHDVPISVLPSLVEFLGSELFVRFSVGGPEAGSPALVAPEDTLVQVDDTLIGKPFVARLDTRSRCTTGVQSTLWFSSNDILLFDAQTGAAISSAPLGT